MSRTVAVLAVAASGLAGAASTPAFASTSDRGGYHHTNVIYLLGDGMGVTQVAATRERYVGPTDQLAVETLRSHAQQHAAACDQHRQGPAALHRPGQRQWFG